MYNCCYTFILIVLLIVVVGGIVYGLMVKVVYPSSKDAVFPKEIQDYYMNKLFMKKTFDMFKNQD